MKERLFMMIMLLLPLSCSIVELGRKEKDESNGVWVAPSVEIDAEVSKSMVFVTGFDYPEGYDWRSDVEQGSVKCSLVVFADEKLFLKVPVGDEYQVGAAPDMHRVIDGHLYTDFCTETETVIKKDGKPFFSYPGREMIVAALVKDDSLWTLGQARSGTGFSFRVNGRPVLSRDRGFVFERLYSADGRMSFAFCEEIKTAAGTVERYYSVQDGVVSQVAVRDDLVKVWDVFCSEGKVWVLASLKGVSFPVVFTGEEMMSLQLPSGSSLVSCRLVSMKNAVLAEGIVSRSGGLMSVLWKNGNPVYVFDKGMTVTALCSSDEGTLYCAANPLRTGGTGVIYRGDEKLTMPAGFSCMSSSAIHSANGLLYVGLASSGGGRPVLWNDGQTHEYDLNGYICSITSRQIDGAY